jgi:hypothetical protein
MRQTVNLVSNESQKLMVNLFILKIIAPLAFNFVFYDIHMVDLLHMESRIEQLLPKKDLKKDGIHSGISLSLSLSLCVCGF